MEWFLGSSKRNPLRERLTLSSPEGLQLIPIEVDAVPSRNGVPERTLVEALVLSLGLKV
jgi:hypothetical protein